MKTALIGLGRIGWSFHLPELTKRPAFGKIIVVDTSADRLAEAHTKYGVDGYSDIDEMLAAEHPDLVVIASPTHLHKAHALKAFAAGANVFCDKPMAVNLCEAREMADAAVEYGRKLMIYQPHRVTPEAQTARELIASGLLGRIYEIKRANSGYSRRSDWQAFTKYGGGMLNNYGAHYIDQLLYLTGANVRDIYCRRRCETTLGDADDVVKVILDCENDLILDLDINQSTACPIAPWMFCGTNGAAVVEKTADGMVFKARYVIPEELPPLEASDALIAAGRKYNADPELPWHEKVFPITNDKALSFYDACEDFYIRGGAPIVPVEETLKVMEILENCRNQSPLK